MDLLLFAFALGFIGQVFNLSEAMVGALFSVTLFASAFDCEVPVRNVPTLSEWGLIAMAGILGIVGFMVIKRSKTIA